MVFNEHNTEWQTGENNLFLGQAPALYDSIHKHHPRLFELYKLQKSIDWSEDEINLEQSRLDLMSCPKSMYDIMVKNLVFQWELDSVASRAISPLFAPFVTNSELWAYFQKVSEIEVLHALTYSEIARYCIQDPQELMREAMTNENVLSRAKTITKAFDDFERCGAEYKLGLVKADQETYNIVFKAVVALFILEGMQFMSSFACTFALCEQDYFQGIGKLVQKIAQDERGVHCEGDRYIILNEMKTERGKVAYQQCRDDIEKMILEALRQEYEWNTYMFSEGRSIVGLTKHLLDEWSNWCSQLIFDTLEIPLPFARLTKSPLKYMDNWLDLDKFQNAQQEGDGNNYSLNVVSNDIGDEELIL